MARMSHDDSVGRDSRFDHLSMLVGWTKRELVGCLQLDVWPMCYDRVAPYLTVLDIDIAANRSAVSPVKFAGGFAAAMVEARLARPATKADTSFSWKPKGWKEGDQVYTVTWPDQDWRGKIYLAGTAERIAYLMRSKLSGSSGGRKSAEVRANRRQGPFEGSLKGPSKGMSHDPQGSTNPPDTASASASAPASASSPDPVSKSPGSPPPAETLALPIPLFSDQVVEPKRPKAKLRTVAPQEALDAAKRLMDQIVKNSPGCSHARATAQQRAATIDRWGDSLRLLHERDGKPWEAIVAMIDWSQAHPFWWKNILSGDKLREKWDQLERDQGRFGPRSAPPAERDPRVGRVEPLDASEYQDGDLTHLL